MKLRIKYHLWYLCQISLQILLLPIQTILMFTYCFIFPINFTFRMKRRTFMRWVSHSIQLVVFFFFEVFFVLTCWISENGIPVDKISKGLKFNNYGVVNVCQMLELIVLVKVSLLFNACIWCIISFYLLWHPKQTQCKVPWVNICCAKN